MTVLNFAFPTAAPVRINGKGTPNGWGVTPIADRLAIVATRTTPKEGEAIFLQTSGLSDEEKRWLGFRWTFDDEAAWKFVPALHPHGNSKGHVWGHNTIHAWNTPGTKTVTLEVTYFDGALDNITTITQTLPITVQPLSVYATAKTWVVDPDGDFTGAPAGNQVTSLSAAKAAAATATGAVLILLRRGKTYPTTGNLNFAKSQNNDVYIYGWGVGADPILDLSGGSSFNLTTCPDTFVARDLRVTGAYDPATGNGGRTNGFRVGSTESFTLNGVSAYGVQDMLTGIGSSGEVPNGFRIFDCMVDRWENFGTYLQTLHLGGFRGFVYTQDLTAVNGDEAKILGQPGNYPDHGPIRISKLMTGCVQHSYSRSINGWSQDNDAEPNLSVYAALMAHQPFLRAGSSTAVDCDFSCTMNYSEGGSLSLEGSSSDGQENYGVGVVCMNYILATANNTTCINTGNTGVAIYNNLMLIPNVLRESGNKRRFVTFTGSPNIQPGWDTGFIDVCFNTMMYLPEEDKDRANPVSVNELLGAQGFAANEVPRHFENNAIIAPNQTLPGAGGPLIADGPLSSTPMGPAPTYAGQRRAGKNGNPNTFDTRYATPAGSNWSGRPLAGAGVLSAVSGADYTRRPVFDVTGALRGATTARGAYDGA